MTEVPLTDKLPHQISPLRRCQAGGLSMPCIQQGENLHSDATEDTASHPSPQQPIPLCLLL